MSLSVKQHCLFGTILSYSGDPFLAPWQEVSLLQTQGCIVIENGHIIDMGDAAIAQKYPRASHHNYGDNILMAGFVDAHMHYPQTAMIASWGKRLIDWLNTYTFPEEARFCDPDYAKMIANRTLDLVIDHGTTTLATYCTIHPESVDAIFSAAAKRNMALVAGKTCMDRNAPDNLSDTPQAAYDQSKALLEKWHGSGRAHYAITPRFSPTSTPEQLAALGALWSEHPTCVMQTHLSEQTDEIAWVKSLFPKARDYLDTYEQFGLLGGNGLYGHAIHLEPREIDRLAEVGASVIHCPTSNKFIGSGLFELAKLKSRGLSVGVATDTGGGSSFSMLRTLAATYEIGQLTHTSLHAAQLLWLATQGSARALKLDHTIGNLAIGHASDIIVLDPTTIPALAQRTQASNDLWEILFAIIMLGDDRSIRATWINGVNQKNTLNRLL